MTMLWSDLITVILFTVTVSWLLTNYYRNLYEESWLTNKHYQNSYSYGVVSSQDVGWMFWWAAGIGAAGAGVFYLTGATTYMASVLGVLVFLLTVTGLFDIRNRYVPSNLFYSILPVTVLMGAGGFVFPERVSLFFPVDDPYLYGLLNFAVYMGAVTLLGLVMLLVLPTRLWPMGWADVIMYLAAGFVLSWYVGVIGMVFLFLIANIILLAQSLLLKDVSGKKAVAALPAYSVAVTLGVGFLLKL